MKSTLYKMVAGSFIVILAMMSGSAFAAKDDNSLVDKKIVLQISDPNPFKQTLVLNVASNLIKHYGQDQVAIEIVAFGPGLRLLFAENSNKGRITALFGSGVRFSACKNTIKNMGKKLGHDPVINSKAIKVAAGVVRIIELQDQGYNLIKP